MTWILGRNLALSLAAAALFAGCGSRSPAGAGQAPARPAAKKAVSPIEDLSRNMVSGVAANKPSTLPVHVKFELRDRPEIGQPLQIELAIVPMSGSIDRVSGKVEGEEGLELLEGEQIAPTDRPAEGVPIHHRVKVLPKREGIFTVRAVVTVDAAGASSTESYSMPVIADSRATGTPGQPAVAAAAPPRAGESRRPGAPAATAAAQ